MSWIEQKRWENGDSDVIGRQPVCPAERVITAWKPDVEDLGVEGTMKLL